MPGLVDSGQDAAVPLAPLRGKRETGKADWALLLFIREKARPRPAPGHSHVGGESERGKRDAVRRPFP
jgi:hypothetical protein